MCATPWADLSEKIFLSDLPSEILGWLIRATFQLRCRADLSEKIFSKRSPATGRREIQKIRRPFVLPSNKNPRDLQIGRLTAKNLDPAAVRRLTVYY